LSAQEYHRVVKRPDIVVAGAGPAGATACFLLAGLGYRVLLLERSGFPRYRIGESLTPSILPLLDFLQLRQKIEDANFLRMAGHTVCWGSPEPRTGYYSPDRSRKGFQVWREDFDSLLLDHARTQKNAAIELGRGINEVRIDSRGVSVNLARERQLMVPFLVDASGHAGICARRDLRRRDLHFRTLAVTGYWRGAGSPSDGDSGNTLLEAYENGVVWSVPLHNGLRNVTVLMDWSEGRRIRETGIRDFYRFEVARLAYVSGFLAGAELSATPRVWDATLYTSREFAGPRFLMAGDAGLFIDPLSSEGVQTAMASAISGTAVINTILDRPRAAADALRFYRDAQGNAYSTHYRQSVEYYGQERRWPRSIFWSRRNNIDNSTANARPDGAAAPLRPPSEISHVRLAPDARIERRPVLEWPYIEMREALVTDSNPRGLRFLHNVSVPGLIEQIKRSAAITDILTGYLRRPEGKHCDSDMVRSALVRLYREGALTAIEPRETLSGSRESSGCS
jgi:flavin-dependent dehydrogenase